MRDARNCYQTDSLVGRSKQRVDYDWMRGYFLILLKTGFDFFKSCYSMCSSESLVHGRLRASVDLKFSNKSSVAE